jgi:hypothetical protein
MVLGSRTISDESTGSISSGEGTEKGYVPPLPSPPSEEVILGLGSKEMLKEEMHRMVLSMHGHLAYAGDMMARMPVRRAV